MFRRLAALAGTSLLAAVFAITPTNIARADNDEPPFINMTTDDTHRTKMAIGFTRKQQDRKHPVTVFLKDKGVNVGAKSKARNFAEHQQMLAVIIKDGGNVVVCPMCMHH